MCPMLCIVLDKRRIFSKGFNVRKQNKGWKQKKVESASLFWARPSSETNKMRAQTQTQTYKNVRDTATPISWPKDSLQGRERGQQEKICELGV